MLRQFLSGVRVLRNDVNLMQMAMVGALARYRNERVQATVEVDGWHSFSGLLGQTLSVIENGDNTETVINGLVTSITWNSNPSTTTIKTGFAR